MTISEPVSARLVTMHAAVVLALALAKAIATAGFDYFALVFMESTAQGSGLSEVATRYFTMRRELTFWAPSDWRVVLWLALLPLVASWSTAPTQRSDRVARALAFSVVAVLFFQWHSVSNTTAPRFGYFVWTMAVLVGLETAAPVRFALLPLFGGIVVASMGDRSVFPTATLQGLELPVMLSVLEGVKTIIDAALVTFVGAVFVGWSRKQAATPTPSAASPSPAAPATGTSSSI